MGSVEWQWIEAGPLLRSQLMALFRDAEMQGCTVTYTKHPGLLFTTYTHVRVEGPDGVVRSVYRAVENASGRLTL